MHLVTALLLALLPFCAAAFSPSGLSFSHNDWELACDNTGTCRAAGYSNHGASDYTVSFLLTRQAGPGQPVSGKAMLGKYGDNPVIDGLPERFAPTLYINGEPHGTLAITRKALTGELSPGQAAALAAALTADAVIELELDDHTWQLSDQGAAAVFLKMDEYQGRLGTPGALVRKGSKAESSVPAALPAPKIALVPPSRTQPADARFTKRHGKALRAALRASSNTEDCSDLFLEDEAVYLNAYRLSPSQMLVSTRCWMAAYNAGAGYWVVNDKPPFEPVLATTSGGKYSAGKIEEQHKGRGLGDCWSSRTLGWDGKRFQLLGESTTGMCRLVAPGGAWSLPTRVTR